MNSLTVPSARIKIVLVILLVILGVGSFIYNQFLISKILEKERFSMQMWADAIEYNIQPKNEGIRRELQTIEQEIVSSPGLPDSLRKKWVGVIGNAANELGNVGLSFTSELIFENRFEIPSVVVDESGNIVTHRNVDSAEVGPELVTRFREKNPPIHIRFGEGAQQASQTVYYGESSTVRLLRYFPYFQFALLALLLGIGYTSYSSIRKNEQSNLWVGMAKEAAHQLGTPVSSLYGWITLLKDQNEDEMNLEIAHELEKDVQRLQIVAARFNKIGSEPELKVKRLGPVLEHVMSYLERRIPKIGRKINLKKEVLSDTKLAINEELFQWAIENLVKNAMDALKLDKQAGQGQLENGETEAEVKLRVQQEAGEVYIDIIDNGCGIPKKYQKEIFKPGYSTKKRGWGLGLSLSKRIIEQYHKGEIFVLSSEIDQGTTIRIKLKAEQS